MGGYSGEKCFKLGLDHCLLLSAQAEYTPEQWRRSRCDGDGVQPGDLGSLKHFLSIYFAVPTI